MGAIKEFYFDEICANQRGENIINDSNSEMEKEKEIVLEIIAQEEKEFMLEMISAHDTMEDDILSSDVPAWVNN